ncbi:isochorismatase family protein [Variovorax sp. HJSM1_2]|uniref:isochorismatase family protein n=1 Tax=Variovorax sp. HJSM1_2 TaxID=3366263 RepID=UPI003BC947B1
MHDVQIRSHIAERVMARRGKFHWFERLDPKSTALVVIDMQSTFCEPGSPAEVASAREIVKPVNALTRRLREMGVPVVWVLHANQYIGDKSDWELFFNNVVSNKKRSDHRVSVTPGKQSVWHELDCSPEDLTIVKNRYSALTPGSSSLERVLRSLGINTILIAGTKTNVCCESTARDAMMMDFQTIMVSDCCAALSDEEHLATLETFIQQFGDVMDSDTVVQRLQA